MKKKGLLLGAIVMIALAGCQKNTPEQNEEDTRVISEGSTQTKIVGGMEIIENEEYVDLGGILSGADAQDVEQLQDSLNMEKVAGLSEEERQKLVGGLDVLADQHNMVVSDIQEAFEEKNVEVNMNETTGKITMDEKILFAKNEYALSKDGKKYLKKFFKTYADAILNSDAEEYVSEIQIIGHTDTSGEYDYNMELSQKRAETVRDYCLGLSSLNKNQKEKLKGMLKPVGKSYDEPIYDGDKVNMEASRRVEFKIMMNIDK